MHLYLGVSVCWCLSEYRIGLRCSSMVFPGSYVWRGLGLHHDPHTKELTSGGHNTPPQSLLGSSSAAARLEEVHGWQEHASTDRGAGSTAAAGVEVGVEVGVGCTDCATASQPPLPGDVVSRYDCVSSGIRVLLRRRHRVKWARGQWSRGSRRHCKQS